MKKVLIAVDGSLSSVRALEYIAERKRGGEELDAVIVNVQPPLKPIGTIITQSMIDDFHWHEGEKILGSPTIKAHIAHLGAEAYVLVGEPAAKIVGLAKELGCSEIVMGGSGRTGVTNLLLGSVVMRVVEQSSVPVVIAKVDNATFVDMAA